MKLPSIQTAMPRAASDPAVVGVRGAQADHDGAARFRDALSLRNKVGRMATRDSEGPVEDGPATAPGMLPTQPPQPLPQSPAPLREKRFDPASASRSYQGGAMPLPADAPRPDIATAAPLPSIDPSAEAGSFAAALSRMDAGITPSPITQIVMTGDQWRMEQAMIAHDGQGLSVEIDLGRQGQQDSDSLHELKARLRARGLDATVDAMSTEPTFSPKS